MTKRSEVKKEIEKALGFHPAIGRYVIMTTGKVRREVHDLQLEINRKHREKNLFIVEVLDWCSIEELLNEYTSVRDWYEGDPSVAAAKRVESKIDDLRELLEMSSGPGRGDDNQDRFHAMIDEARSYLDKHDYQIAKLLLKRIKVQCWDKLNARHKFRVLTNLAVVELSADNPKGAAELFLNAKKYQPADKTARTNEARSCLILGQRERAFELADKLKDEFPRSKQILGIFIQSAPDSMPLESFEESVPQDLLGEEEVAVALTYRALDSNELAKAETFIRSATGGNSHTSMTWLLLGRIILQSEISQNYQRHGTGALVCDQDRLHEAEDALGQALMWAGKERSTSATVEALLNRSRTRFLLDKNAEARKDLVEARRIAPENSLVIETYGESLRFEGKTDDAIEYMRRLGQEKLSDHGRLMLGMLLIERGRSGDHRSAADLFSRVAKSEAKLPEDFRENAIEVGLQAFASQRKFDAGQKLLEKVPEGTISDVCLKTLVARLYLLEGRQEDASQFADQALDIISDVTSIFDVRRIARLLSDLGRFNDALPLWQRTSVPSVLSEDTMRLLECASRLNRHEVMLDTFEKLRDGRAIDRTLLDTELSLLERYDTEAAIKILEKEINQRPDDTELKLRGLYTKLAKNCHRFLVQS